MSTQKAKFALFQKLQDMGFTYEEAVSLRRIEMTLQRWAEAECNGEIERDEFSGIPQRRFPDDHERLYGRPIADREAGALRRLKAIVDARNKREACKEPFLAGYEYARDNGAFVIPYHQGDPRGCALYLVKRSDLPEWTDERIVQHSGPSAIATPERRQATLLSMYYNRGLAVCC